MKHCVEIDYTGLGLVALIKILELADLMGVSPKVAAEAYLRHQAMHTLSNRRAEDAGND